jgi:hypothetical protein
MSNKADESTRIVPAWVQDLPARARRLASALGPWLLSQSEELSKKYTRHELRQAGVEIFKQAMSAEMTTFAQARKQLLLRLAKVEDPVERVNITANLRYVEEEVRRFSVYVSAFEQTKEETTEAPNPEITTIDAVWLDRFDDLAKRHNEPWRRELLAKALVLEAEQPGTIGLRVLWLIGTMEEISFVAFSTILDLGMTLDGQKIIPDTLDSKAHIPGCALSKTATLGNLAYILDDTGLLASKEAHTRAREDTMTASYGDRTFVIGVGKGLKIGGVLLSGLGLTLARLHDAKFNQLGSDAFEKWIKRFGDKAVETTKNTGSADGNLP